MHRNAPDIVFSDKSLGCPALSAEMILNNGCYSKSGNLRSLLPGSLTLVMCTAGGAVAGTSHFVGTAKALEEEGITRAQRLKALPTAVRDLPSGFMTFPIWKPLDLLPSARR